MEYGNGSPIAHDLTRSHGLDLQQTQAQTHINISTFNIPVGVTRCNANKVYLICDLLSKKDPIALFICIF